MSGEVLRIPRFARYWAAETVGAFGTAVTAFAVPVLVVVVLDASATEVGIVNAVQFLPYLLVGLPAGALVDRWRRRSVLVWTHVGRGVALLVVPLLWLADALSLGAVCAVLFGFGVLSVFGWAAAQSFVRSLVPRGSLVAANARIGQSAAVAQTSGPVVGGGLVGWVGAPLAVLVDAAGYLVCAALVASVPVREERPAAGPGIRGDIAAGLRWTYRHRTLAPLAVSTHVWFVGNAAALTVFAPFALRDLGFPPPLYGLVLAAVGGGGFLGALLAPRAGRRFGEGTTVLLGRLGAPVAWLVVAVVPDGGPAAFVLVAAAQAVYGFGLGLEDPNELGYRQAVTPDGLLGRTNATMRSANRTMAVVGALAGGVLADRIGPRPTLWLAVGVFLVAVAVALPLRGVRADDQG